MKNRVRPEDGNIIVVYPFFGGLHDKKKSGIGSTAIILSHQKERRLLQELTKCDQRN